MIFELKKKPADLPGPTLYAKVVMSDGTSWCQEIEYWKQVGGIPRAKELPMRHGPDSYYCNVLRIKLEKYGEPPLYVAISRKNTCEDLMPPMPIYYDKRDKIGKFAVCLQKPLFDKIPPETVLHWVELNRALGASIITIMLQNMPQKVYQILLPYVKSGLVDIVDWKISVKIRNYGGNSLASECFYRNINRAEYIAMHDIDEFIIPYKHNDWFGMLDDLRNSTNVTNYAGFKFASMPWAKKGQVLQSVNKMKCENMILPAYFSMIYRWENIDKRPKMMLSSERALTAHFHNIPHWIEGVDEQFEVEHDIGLCHHYRVIPMKGNYVPDSTMERFVGKVMPNIVLQTCTSKTL